MMREFVIEAGRAERHYWYDLWQYRELFRVLAWRDVSVRYKQTVIGIACSIAFRLSNARAAACTVAAVAACCIASATMYTLLLLPIRLN